MAGLYAADLQPIKVVKQNRTKPRAQGWDRSEWPTSARLYVQLASVSFALYATFGRGFAYLGYQPIFIGEFLLVLGLIVALKSRKLVFLFHDPFGVLMTGFMLWQASCTIPYLGMYGVDAARDAASWGYSLFAWIAAALILQLRGVLGSVIARFRRFAGLYLFIGPAFAVASNCFGEYLPKWPGTNAMIPNLKSGDMCVHLAGIVSFAIVGLARRRVWWIVPGLFGLAVGFSISRGGGVAFITAVTLILVLYPRPKWLYSIGVAIFLILLSVFVFNTRIRFSNSGREISSEQIIRNAHSIVNGDDSDLQGTKQWRIEWWNRIVDYTVHGPYFWMGKGYGVNLTLSDGIERTFEATGGLRSPHNSNLTFLARSGVPGLALWIALQLSWCGIVLISHFRARSLGLDHWAAFFAWLFAYWISFMINATFDVSFEGPTMGIAFWTILGLGWGGYLAFHQRQPNNLRAGLYAGWL